MPALEPEVTKCAYYTNARAYFVSTYQQDYQGHVKSYPFMVHLLTASSQIVS